MFKFSLTSSLLPRRHFSADTEKEWKQSYTEVQV